MVKLPRIQSGRFKTGFLVVIGLCLVIGLILIGPNGQNNLPSSQSVPATPQSTGPVANNQTKSLVGVNPTSNNQSVAPASGQSQSTIKTSQPASPQPATSSSPSTTTTNSQVTATLMVNGVVQGKVSVATGTTQCGLIVQALVDGVINQLTIKYNSSYKSRGVYQINNQGDANNMLWVYAVNGAEPPVGCDSVTVHDNDSVNWQYLRS